MTEPAAPVTPRAPQDAAGSAQAGLAHPNAGALDAMRRDSLADPEAFWRKQGRRLAWMRPYTKVQSPGHAGAPARWFEDGVLNVSFNCIDRHLPRLADAPAILLEGEGQDAERTIGFADLYSHVCRMANVLRRCGVRKGDRVALHLPAIPEAVYAILACARIGAVHVAASGAASAGELAALVAGSGAVCAVTTDEAGGAHGEPMKRALDEALLPENGADSLSTVIVVRRTDNEIDMTDDRDMFYDDIALRVPDECDPEEMGAEDPLFILHGALPDGRAGGLVHASGGYLLWALLCNELAPEGGSGGVFGPLSRGLPVRIPAGGAHPGSPLQACGRMLFDGVSGLPLPGVAPVLVSADGAALEGAGSGDICVAAPWPGQPRTIFGDDARFSEVFLGRQPGLFFTGLTGERDAQGRWRAEGAPDLT